MDILAQKKCTSCKKTKPVDEFTKDARTSTGVASICKSCNKSKSKLWRDKNPQKSRESVKNYRENHPGKAREMYDDWASRNPERVRELGRENYKKHAVVYRESAKKRHVEKKIEDPEYGKEYQAKWRKENPEKVKESQNKWAKAHPEKVTIKSQTRHARKRNTPGAITEREWIEVLEKYNYTCLWCLRNDVRMTMDHVVPLSRGGLHVVGNVQPLCKTCNSRKGAKTMDFR